MGRMKSLYYILSASLLLNCFLAYLNYKNEPEHHARTLMGAESLIRIENRTHSDICYIDIMDTSTRTWYQPSTVKPEFRFIPGQVETFGASAGGVSINLGDCNGMSVAGTRFDVGYGEERKLRLKYAPLY